jgi:hypothetical protein
MAFAVALVLPSVALWIIGGLLPSLAGLFCFRCNTTAFFKVPRNPDNCIVRVYE